MIKVFIKLSIATFFASSAYAYDFCASLEGVKDQATLKTKIQKLISLQTKNLNLNNNRYVTARKLNQCSPIANSKGLFLAFAGTGAFNPRSFNIMQKLIKCKHVRKMPEWLQKNSYYTVQQSLKAQKSNFSKWSLIESGPMKRMMMASSLKSKMAKFNFAIYPSEESEIIADFDQMGFSDLKNLPPEMSRSNNGSPTGIQNALNCTKIYLAAMKKRGETPNIVIMSHSSGGRSVVKFLEKLKKTSKEKASLVFTVDPVKEAQHAISEVIPQISHRYVQQAAGWILNVDVKERKAAVWSRKQPKVLYKTTNSERWINFYQIVDTKGLKGPVQFGIKGSPVHKASKNYLIKDSLGSDAHGAIGSHVRVLDTIEDELLDL